MIRNEIVRSSIINAYVFTIILDAGVETWDGSVYDTHQGNQARDHVPDTKISIEAPVFHFNADGSKWDGDNYAVRCR